MGQLVFIENNQVITDSLTVAEVFGKDHRNVIRDVENQLEKLNEAGEREWGVLNFEQTQYKHQQNKQWYPKFNMTEDAFAIIAMSYVTPEAMKMKIKFLNEFKRMREMLNNKPMSIEDMIVAQAQSVKELKNEVSQQSHQISQIKLVVDNEVWVTEHQKHLIQEAVKMRVRGLLNEGYDAHYQAIYGALKRHFGVAKYDKIPRKNFDTAIRFVNGWYPPRKQKDLV